MHRIRIRLPLAAVGTVLGAGTVHAASASLSFDSALDARSKVFERILRSGASTTSAPQLTPIPVVGGHAGILGDGYQVLKPCTGPRGLAEAAFYRRAFDQRWRDGGSGVARFTPGFFGISTREENLPSGPQHMSYIVLEDLTTKFSKPSIMDIKVGVQTWDENASPEKAEAERRKYPIQQVVGFRFTGMRVWNEAERRFKEHGRNFGYALDEQNLHKAFEEYLHDGTRVRTELIPPLLDRLREIESWFESQSDFRFYGSSLLFVYDSSSSQPKLDVRMIDFAHVWPITEPNGRDDGYLLGLRNIKRCLQRVRLQHS